MITVRHRRATEEEWLRHDPVIPDGELALVSSDVGYDVRIGDGVRKYSELSPIMGKFVQLDEPNELELTLGHRDRVSLTWPYSLDITLDHQGHDDYVAMLSFDTMGEAPEFYTSVPHVVYSGTHIREGYFVPEPNMHYTLLFWKDGVMNCHVRGVYVG